MKVSVVLASVLLFLLVSSTFGEKVKKYKKYVKKHRTTTPVPEVEVDEKDVFSMMEQDEKEEQREEKEELERLQEQQEERQHEQQQELKDEPEELVDNEVMQDPCAKKHCGAGKVCDLNDKGEAVCVCIPDCPEESDPRRKVCSNHNETWGSDCEVYQMRCWCNHGSDKCRSEDYKHVHIEYYGECRELPECSSEEMDDFPRRMREWLFNIMRDLADRQELTPHYLKMEREAETNMTKRWTNAAVWKWCDLDGHPPDRSVSRHELFPIRAPLISLEHCIADFLDSCDSNDDHRISLKEWGKCLKLDEDELEEKCDELRDSQ